jgi:hypothetical protein
VSPVSTMSSTTKTSRSWSGVPVSLVIRTSPLDVVPLPYEATPRNSSCSGREMARTRSATNSEAPFRTQSTVSGRPA